LGENSALQMKSVAVKEYRRRSPALWRLFVATALFWLPAISVISGDLREANPQPIDDIVNREIEFGNIPGAVILIGQQGQVVYRRAFGYRALEPQKLPMTEDTIFDLASLTKVIATTTAVMQLVEQGKFRLNDRVERYWPEFGTNGKKEIRVRDLLTHTSGLRAGLNGNLSWSGYSEALKQVTAETSVHSPGKDFLYSDINFIVLGELIARTSGLPLDLYCAQQIFAKLGMKDTGFKPDASRFARIAPTTFLNGKPLQGEVHDPTAYKMGGVSGHAGLFSTADDLALFARMVLNSGMINGSQILQPASIAAMTTRQQVANGNGWWGLGWEITPHFNSNGNDWVPVNSFGHGGYTGTSLWIEPDSKSYVIILTNRVHPRGNGDVKPLRSDVLRYVAEMLVPSSNGESKERSYRQGDAVELSANQKLTAPGGAVRSGIDELTAQAFAPLKGLRVGLITNQTGIDSKSRRTVDLLFNAPGVKLTALFNPEHGLNGEVDERVSSSVEPVTKLTVHSLYGTTRRPTEETLQGLDALVFDIQDAGARFYTYITTMMYAMEEAARQSIRFFVLDRPNPINSSMVQGPVMDTELKSFTGYFPLPVRHGMTIGELATMFNHEWKIGADLHVVKMTNYRRDFWYDQTGLPWIGPSPNLRTLTAVTLYPGVAIVEGANVSVGRGTDTPFELIGAPWIDGKGLANYLNQRKIRGVSFVATSFMPTSDRYKNLQCHGVRVVIENRNDLDTPQLGVEITSALHRLYGNKFQLENTRDMIGSRWVIQAIKDGTDARTIAQRWEASLEEFRKLRAGYLLYPATSTSEN
jgi:uncharacterized protein YbbC (DUF1343 family)/CubicO group peptidase (beta-lactamase class C family)